jgi:hypothetical protein
MKAIDGVNCANHVPYPNREIEDPPTISNSTPHESPTTDPEPKHNDHITYPLPSTPTNATDGGNCAAHVLHQTQEPEGPSPTMCDSTSHEGPTTDPELRPVDHINDGTNVAPHVPHPSKSAKAIDGSSCALHVPHQNLESDLPHPTMICSTSHEASNTDPESRPVDHTNNPPPSTPTSSIDGANSAPHEPHYNQEPGWTMKPTNETYEALSGKSAAANCAELLDTSHQYREIAAHRPNMRGFRAY